MKFYTNCILSAFLLCVMVGGCSNNDNPMQFEKINSPQPQMTMSSKTYSLLELYLLEKIEREYLIAWFFSDAKLYRAKLFYIKNEILTPSL